MHLIEVCEIAEMDQVVRCISHSSFLGKRIVKLSGELGAGKTAFVKQFMLCKYGFNQVSSPTFSLVNEYQTDKGLVYHFDLYRLENTREIEEIGFWDYLDTADWVFIEWPDKIADLLPPEETLSIAIKLNLKGCREFSIS